MGYTTLVRCSFLSISQRPIATMQMGYTTLVRCSFLSSSQRPISTMQMGYTTLVRCSFLSISQRHIATMQMGYTTLVRCYFLSSSQRPIATMQSISESGLYSPRTVHVFDRHLQSWMPLIPTFAFSPFSSGRQSSWLVLVDAIDSHVCMRVPNAIPLEC
jgi:hypothetical protein